MAIMLFYSIQFLSEHNSETTVSIQHGRQWESGLLLLGLKESLLLNSCIQTENNWQ